LLFIPLATYRAQREYRDARREHPAADREEKTTMIETTYHIEMQKIGQGWIYSVQQLVWEGGEGRDGLYEDSDQAFPTAAEAAADAERRIAEMETGIPYWKRRETRRAG
jgi:hypothetical protein